MCICHANMFFQKNKKNVLQQGERSNIDKINDDISRIKSFNQYVKLTVIQQFILFNFFSRLCFISVTSVFRIQNLNEIEN